MQDENYELKEQMIESIKERIEKKSIKVMICNDVVFRISHIRIVPSILPYINNHSFIMNTERII